MAGPDEGWRQHVLGMLPRMEQSAAGLTPGPVETVAAPKSFSLPPGPPQHDVTEALPVAAQERLRKLRLRRDDAHALVPEFEDVRASSMAKIEAENAHRRLVSHPQDGGFNLPEHDARVIAATKAVEKATDEFERLKALQEVRTAAFQAASGALSSVENWLRHGVPGGVTLQDCETEPPRLLKGESSLLDAIENRRRRVRELRADQHRTASACYPSSYCKDRMRAQIEALSQRGAPDCSMLIEHDREITWPEARLASSVYNVPNAPGAVAFGQIIDVVPLVAWLFKDQLIARLDAEIDAEADDQAALMPAQREQQEAEILGDLLAVEREECALVWRAQSEGLPVEFRADISPQALLGVKLVTMPRGAPPETTLGYSWPHRP